ncbi:MAG: ATP-dependent DNA helicase RecG [Candidatus Aerophobetes bacterium]|nr:ATP-dependent DNA helicase RecG [Candidatus Aerophobetes bacterium]
MANKNKTSFFKGPDFFSPVRYAKGVGERRAIRFKRLGIRTIFDLLWHFPTRYEDRSHISPILNTSPGQKYVIQGQVLAVSQFKTQRKLSIIKAAIRDRTGVIYAIWYNQEYLSRLLKRGKRVVISGKVRWGGNKFREKQIKVEDFELLTGDEEDNLHLKRIVPFYPLTEGLSQRTLRRIVKINLDGKSSYLVDPLPEEIRRRYSFSSLKEALNNVHFPESFSRLKESRRRLIFEELFLLQCALALKRKRYKGERGISFQVKGGLAKWFINSLPFSLTPSQKMVIKEILEDMCFSRPMNRLLQGDVGSGKTIVATVSLLTALVNGYQGALMAPTEILAQQHWLNLRELLRPLNIQPALLVSDLPPREKREVIKRIREGKLGLVIGTHALIQKEVDFHNLGMVVIDEQHRFGVIQRLSLRNKGRRPDVLVMTATPIPRTLALTTYGDLDLSVIDELPPGRKSVITRWESERRRTAVYEFIRNKLKEGKQAYFVYPLIEESEEMDLKPAIKMAEQLQRETFPHYYVQLLHGRMSREEKERIMQDFRAGKIDVLVSTTVIEVGIDVPNANIMVIENAERFGLAQLHQLRGRIGRGMEQSYCFLITGRKISQEAVKRMKVMCRTTDGFRIAEEDLKLRGPGEFFGTRQWGMFNLRIADLVKDSRILYLAQKEAFQLVEKDPLLRNYPQLRERLEEGFATRLELAKVG